MNCSRATSLISAYLDSELSGRDMLSLQRHLNDCGSCQAELESIRTLRQELSSLREPDVPLGFESRLREAVYSAQPAKTATVRARTFLLTAACAAVVTLAVQQSMPRSPSQPVYLQNDIDTDQARLAASDPLSGAGPSLVSSPSYGP